MKLEMKMNSCVQTFGEFLSLPRSMGEMFMYKLLNMQILDKRKKLIKKQMDFFLFTIQESEF
jgi:hypothetical protein